MKVFLRWFSIQVSLFFLLGLFGFLLAETKNQVFDGVCGFIGFLILVDLLFSFCFLVLKLIYWVLGASDSKKAKK